MDKHGITIFTTYISVDHAHHAIFRAKVCKDEYITHCNLGNFAYLLYLAEFFFSDTIVLEISFRQTETKTGYKSYACTTDKNFISFIRTSHLTHVQILS